MAVLRVVLTLLSLRLAQAATNFTNSTTSSSASSTSSFVSSATLGALGNLTTSAAGNSSGEFCNAQQISWSQASVAYSSSHPYVTSVTNSYHLTTTLYSHNNWNCTRMCDTICYAGPTTVNMSTSTYDQVNVVTYTTGSTYPSPSPNCSIGTSDCFSLKTSYSSASKSWWSLTDSLRSMTPSPISPKCSACIATGCTFAHAGMKLYYWPVTANVSVDWCAWTPLGGQATTGLPNPNTTYIETTTGPYAVVDGITMYSGNAYLSMSEPFVTDNCQKTITRKSPGHNIITIASSDLYSVRGYPHNVIPWSVNWVDFNEPTPWSAYLGGWYCANNRPICSVVFPHDYYPVFSMPGQIRQLDPNWASCTFSSFGIFDPPTALHSVGNIFSTSTPHGPSTTDPDPVVTSPPNPGQSPSDGKPSATKDPSKPSDPSNPDPGSSHNPNPPKSTNNADPTNAVPGGNPGTKTNADPTTVVNNPGGGTPPGITPGPSVIVVDPTSGVVLNPGTTVRSGGAPVVISSTTFSVGPGGLTIVSPTTSTQVPIGSKPITLSVGSNVVLVDPTKGVVINPGVTLSSGGAPVVMSGTTFSIGSGGLTIISPTTSTIVPIGSNPVTLSLGSNILLVDPTSGVVINLGAMLSSGGPPVVISGTTYSVGSGGLTIISPTTSTHIPIGSLGNDPMTLTLGPGSSQLIIDPSSGGSLSKDPAETSNGSGNSPNATNASSGVRANKSPTFAVLVSVILCIVFMLHSPPLDYIHYR